MTSASQSLQSLGGRKLSQRVLGTLHPNEAGHDDTTRALLPALEATLDGKPLPVPTGVIPGAEVTDGDVQQDDEGLSTLAIVGIVFGGVVAWVLAGLIVIRVRWWLRAGGGPLGNKAWVALLTGGVGVALVGVAILLRDEAAVATPFAAVGAAGVLLAVLIGPVLRHLESRAHEQHRWRVR